MRQAFSAKADAMYTRKKEVESRRSGRGRSSRTIYLFRFGESGLYAFTTDPMGHILPSRIYPRMRWEFERRVTLRLDGNSPPAEVVRAALDAIAEHGFHLAHSAINAELLAVAAQRCDQDTDQQEAMSELGSRASA